MLLDDAGRRIDGPQANVLEVIHETIAATLVGDGCPEGRADELATLMLPRIQQHLADRGYVTRELHSDTVKREASHPATHPTDTTPPGT